jgi:hypothetical protein
VLQGWRAAPALTLLAGGSLRRRPSLPPAMRNSPEFSLYSVSLLGRRRWGGRVGLGRRPRRTGGGLFTRLPPQAGVMEVPRLDHAIARGPGFRQWQAAQAGSVPAPPPAAAP